MHAFTLLILTLVSTIAYSGVIPDAQRESLIRKVQKSYWGTAKLPDGSVIQPLSDAERQSIPVNRAVANFAMDVGELSGLAEWCGLDWERSINALMRNARKNKQTEKQVAFIAMLHGIAQGAISSAMSKSGQCQPQEREKVSKRLENILALEP